MKLTDLDTKNVATRALNEGFGINLNVSKLNRSETLEMLRKVTG